MSDQRGRGTGLKMGERNGEGGLAGSNGARPGPGIMGGGESVVER